VYLAVLLKNVISIDVNGGLFKYICLLQTRKYLVGFQGGNSIMCLLLCSWLDTKVSGENIAVIFRVNCKEHISSHGVAAHKVYRLI